MKVSWGHIEIKDGGGRKGREQVIVEVTTGYLDNGKAHNAWAYLTKKQAKRVAEQLLRRAK